VREPPANLADETLRACLRESYGLAVAEITFLPLGHDPSAWVYRARTADSGDYFVKVRLSVTNEAGVLIPRYLRDQGIKYVVAPIPTLSRAPWANADGYAVLLYPFIDGATGMERGMSDRQWIDYGVLLRQVHDTAVMPDLARVMPRESYAPVGADSIERLDADVGADADARTFDDPAAKDLAMTWWAHRADIRTLLERAVDLGQRLARAAPPFVLCHADIHTANVQLDAGGQVWFVDWDETVLAPRERDLMFVVGGGISTRLVGPREEALFFQGYGQGYGATTVDPLALTYYRYAWAVADVGAYGEEVFYRPDLGPVTRRAAVEQFQSLFAPGNIVSLAFASDADAASRPAGDAVAEPSPLRRRQPTRCQPMPDREGGPA